MKIKFGFITNSSSVSFIIENEENTGMVLKKMWDHFIGRLRKNYPEIETYPEHIEAERWINENYKSFNDNIIIPWTCNYETLIFNQDQNIIVETCRNENWGEMENLEIIHIDDYDYEKIEFTEFLDLTDMKIKTYKQFLKDNSNLPLEEIHNNLNDKLAIIKEVSLEDKRKKEIFDFMMDKEKDSNN